MSEPAAVPNPSVPESAQPVAAPGHAPGRPDRMLLQAVAVSLLILTGTVFIFIYRQVVLMRSQSADIVTFLANYERSNEPAFIEQVHAALLEFKGQNPDFAPIYMKYFGTNMPAPKVSAAPAAATNTPPRPAP